MYIYIYVYIHIHIYIHIYIYRGFHSHGGTPITGWFITGNSFERDDNWGYPHDLGNHHVSIMVGKKAADEMHQSKTGMLTEDFHKQKIGKQRMMEEQTI